MNAKYYKTEIIIEIVQRRFYFSIVFLSRFHRHVLHEKILSTHYCTPPTSYFIIYTWNHTFCAGSAHKTISAHRDNFKNGVFFFRDSEIFSPANVFFLRYIYARLAYISFACHCLFIWIFVSRIRLDLLNHMHAATYNVQNRWDCN